MNNVETVVEEPQHVKDAFEAIPPVADFSVALSEEPPACGHPECADNDTSIRQSIQQAAEVVYRLLTSGAGSVRAIFYTNNGQLMFSGVEAADQAPPEEVMQTLLRAAGNGHQESINVLQHAAALGIVELEQRVQVSGFPSRGNASNN